VLTRRTEAPAFKRTFKRSVGFYRIAYAAGWGHGEIPLKGLMAFPLIRICDVHGLAIAGGTRVTRLDVNSTTGAFAMSVNLAGKTAKSVCSGSAPLWVLGQRSLVHSTLFDFIVGLFWPVTTAYCAYFAKQGLYVAGLPPSGDKGRRFESSQPNQSFQ
jgi:hypothetical protein